MTKGQEYSNYIQHFQPIGPRFPVEAFNESIVSTCKLISNSPPLGKKFDSLVTDNNKGLLTAYFDKRDTLTPEQAIEKSNKYAESYIHWQAVRHIGSPEYKLTGFEPYEIGHELFDTKDNPTAIALHIALQGLRFQKIYPSLAGQLLIDKGLNNLTYLQLKDVDDILGGEIRKSRASMTPEAKRFQEKTRTLVENMPGCWKHIYYMKQITTGEINQLLVIPKLEMHPALRKPGNVAEFARKHDIFEEEEALKKGRLIVKYLSQGGSPLARIFKLGCASIE